MGKVTQLKWIPPRVADGYRADTVHEAVHSAAAEILLAEEEDCCTAIEVAVANRAMKMKLQGNYADACTAADLAILYAAQKRLIEAANNQLRAAVVAFEAEHGRPPTTLELSNIMATLWPAATARYEQRVADARVTKF